MAALVFLLTVGSTDARTLDQMPPYLKKEGSFVAVPAVAGGGLLGVVGGALGLVAAPVTALVGWAAGDPLGYALLPVSAGATVGAEAGYHMGGAVPWALKKGFYDAPMAGIAKIKGEPASGLVAQVDPPPTVAPVDLQYLASTPPAARVPVVPPYNYSRALPPPRELTSLMLKRALSPFKLPPNAAMPHPKSASLSRQTPLSPAASGQVPVRAATSAPATTVPAPAVTSPAATQPSPAVQPAPVRAPVRTAAPAVQKPEQAAPAPAETAESTADTGSANDAAPAERPSLKKKKSKFSERFRF